MRLNNSRIFLQSAAKDFRRTGAVVPSSRALAHAMTSELAQNNRRAVDVLEVGGGTGSITEEIVRHIGHGGRLDVYEIDYKLACLLQTRVREDRAFQDAMAPVRIHNKAIECISPRQKYDFVISCLPFTNFDARLVRQVFELYRAVLKPGGICSFYEYILLRKAARIVSGKPSERKRVSDVSRVVSEYTDRYGYKKNMVLRNFPPAIVYHIDFGCCQ